MNATPTTSRSLTQEELDSYYRADFVNAILAKLDEANGREIRFLAIGNHYSLIRIKRVRTGEFEFSYSPDHSYYTYRFSHVVDFLEKIYDKKVRIESLNGEVEIPKPVHLTANDDAEEEAPRQDQAQRAPDDVNIFPA